MVAIFATNDTMCLMLKGGSNITTNTNSVYSVVTMHKVYVIMLYKAFMRQDLIFSFYQWGNESKQDVCVTPKILMTTFLC